MHMRLREVHRPRISISAPFLFSWPIFRVNWIFPPFFSLVFAVVQAERMVLYIGHCFPFELSLQES